MQKQSLFHFSFSHLFIVLALSLCVIRTHAQQGSTVSGMPGNGTKNDSIGVMLSLPQAVDIAIKNNLVVNQYDLTMQQDKVNMDQSWGNLLPTLNANGSQNLGFGRSLNNYNYTYVNQQINSGSYGIGTGLTLFSGLALQNAIRQNTYAYNAGKLDLRYQKDQITLTIILYYLQVLSAQDQLAIIREQAFVDSQQVARLVALNDAGGSPTGALSDLPNLQGQYAADLANIATAANALETAKINLFQLLNVPYKRDVEFDRGALALQLTDYQETPDSIYETALKVVPAIEAAELRVKAYEKGVAVARGAYYPTLSFSGSVSTNFSNAATTSVPGVITQQPTGDFVTVGGTQYNVIGNSQAFTSKNISFGDQFNNNRYTTLGLTLTVPILNYFRVRNNVRSAKLNLKNYEYINTNTRLGLQQNVETAYQNMILAYKQYKAYIDEAAAYAEAFRITQERFNEGVINVNADLYLQAKNRTDQANLALSQAKYTYIFRTKWLDYYQGKLTL